MSIKRKHVKTGTIVLIIVSALVVMGAFGVVARTWQSPIVAAHVGSESVPTLIQRTRPIADFESELITIMPHGFEPQAITRPRGRFLLMIDDRSGLATTSLALTRETGARTHELTVPRERPNWSEVVNLPPGRYVLTESNHPGWTCLITIMPQ